MQPSEFRFERLFGGTPVSEASQLTDETLIPIQGPDGIQPVPLSVLRAVFGGDGGGSVSPKWEALDISAYPQEVGDPVATLQPGKSYIIVSHPANVLEVALPAGIPLLQPFAIHAKGGPITINPLNLYTIAGAVNGLSLEEGESVYFLQHIAGTLEIV